MYENKVNYDLEINSEDNKKLILSKDKCDKYDYLIAVASWSYWWNGRHFFSRFTKR